MRIRACHAVALLTVVFTSGCSINDPTEVGGGMDIVNALDTTVRISYCKDLGCERVFWTDTIGPKGRSNDSVAADGSRQRFVVVGKGLRGCITVRLTRSLAEAGLVFRRSAIKRCLPRSQAQTQQRRGGLA